VHFKLVRIIVLGSLELKLVLGRFYKFSDFAQSFNEWHFIQRIEYRSVEYNALNGLNKFIQWIIS